MYSVHIEESDPYVVTFIDYRDNLRSITLPKLDLPAHYRVLNFEHTIKNIDERHKNLHTFTPTEPTHIHAIFNEKPTHQELRKLATKYGKLNYCAGKSFAFYKKNVELQQPSSPFFSSILNWFSEKYNSFENH